MAPNRTKHSNAGLGKALLNRKAKDAVAPRESQLYILDDSNPLASVTHERDLDEFLAKAALADHDFTTERTKTRIVSSPSNPAPQSNPYLLSAAEERKVVRKQQDLRHGLRVPRRPQWTRHTTSKELDREERESFIAWRRDLAHLAEESNLLLTPFERNIQLWRQLWRVLERSHLIVQIVDARNPIGFRCSDLDIYVREVGSNEIGEETTVPGKGKRRSLLLINKADLLTYEQRSAWADYFESEKISYAFFSATDAAALQEQADKQRRREAGEEDLVDENEEEEGPEDEEDASVDEVEHQSPQQAISTALEGVELEDEDSWSTDGDEDDEEEGEVKKWSPAAAAEVKTELEDIRTRVLTVVELEDLFEASAPDIADFATSRDPHPTKLMVGLVGYPNVGKSSTINALLGAKKVSVSSTPGKTKHFQTLMLSDRITLCDCPGLVFPQFANTQADMVCDGVLPIDQMREYSAPVDLVCRRIPRDILEGTYSIRIDVKEIEDGGTGLVGWEDFLSAYAIARGMTRSSFGMPDTSRAARHVLKDYVNARLLYGHPPPGIDPEEYMTSSRELTLQKIEESFLAGRKRAPATHVSKNADTYVAPAAPRASADQDDDGADDNELLVTDEEREASGAPEPTNGPRERQLTSQSIRTNAASAPMRSGKYKAAALDGAFFTESGPAPRPVVKGRSQGAAAEAEGGLGFARSTMYPHQRRLGPDGMPLFDEGVQVRVRNNGKKHFKVKEGKQRSGRGYD